MTGKNIVFSVVFFLFLVFPFFYFSLLSSTHLSFLSTTEMIYLAIILISLCFAFCVENFFKNKLSQEMKNLSFILFATGIWFYGAFLLLMTWSRYQGFISESIDVVYFHQVIWQLSEFKIPYLWNLNQQFYPTWSQHFSPILIFIAPFFWISHSGGLMMILQAAAAISGAPDAGTVWERP